jgi:mannosyl-oligosaccharide alpha-1,2-mannosidase
MTKHSRPGGLTRRRLLGGLATTLTPAAALAGTASAAPAAPDPYAALGADVVTEFRTAWDSYRRLAWGRDE